MRDADRANAGAAGAFLTPGLFAAALNLAPLEGAGLSQAAVGQVGAVGLADQFVVGLDIKDGLIELDGSLVLGAGLGVRGCGCHGLKPPYRYEAAFGARDGTGDGQNIESWIY